MLKALPNAKRKLNVYSYLLQKRLKKQLQRFMLRPQVQVQVIRSSENDYDSIADDLPLTIVRDPRPGIRQESVSP